jgi:hypothetical protein
MATDPQVAVVGLRALNRDLNRALDDRGPISKAMSQAGRTAAEPVAAAVRGALPHVSGTLAGDVRVNATRTGATVRMGRKTVPYAGWIDFGGTRHSPHESTRDFVRTGRYLFPAAAGLAPKVAGLYSAALTEAFDTFPWENTTSNGESVHD